MRCLTGLFAIGVCALLGSCGGGDEGGGGGGAKASGGGGAGTGATTSGGSGGTPVGGSGGTSTGGTTGGSGGSAGSGGSVVACSATTSDCIAPAPLNWTGPVAYFVGSGSVPACPGAFPTKDTAQHASLDEGTASCDCQCDGAKGISCSGNAKIAKVASILQCATSAGTTSLSPNICTPGSYAQGYWAIDLPVANGGSCLAKPTSVLPTATWKEEAQRCSGAISQPNTDCPAGTECFPTIPSPFKSCVWRPGDQACPTAYYSEKFLAYDDKTDTRACSACTCADPTGKSCGLIDFTSSCLIFATSYGTGTGCANITATASAATYKANPTGTCTPQGGTLSGSVSKSGEVTYCCAKS